MKKYLLLALVLITGLSACKKTATYDAAAQAAKDDAAIKTYLAANPSITATKDASGMYYQIVTPGTGAAPTTNNTISINYVGKLLDGTTFETGTGSQLLLSSTIQGWQIGVPYIKTGGRIILIIPSALGYGNAASGAIPANAVLVFTIDLLGIK